LRNGNSVDAPRAHPQRLGDGGKMSTDSTLRSSTRPSFWPGSLINSARCNIGQIDRVGSRREERTKRNAMIGVTINRQFSKTLVSANRSKRRPRKRSTKPTCSDSETQCDESSEGRSASLLPYRQRRRQYPHDSFRGVLFTVGKNPTVGVAVRHAEK